jgi:hypothetical protein
MGHGTFFFWTIKPPLDTQELRVEDLEPVCIPATLCIEWLFGRFFLILFLKSLREACINRVMFY